MDRDREDNPAPNQPVEVIRDGRLKASIWRNEGEERDFYATTFTRSYKDRDGEYRDTNSFVAADLLKISELAREAYNRTRDMSRADREQERRPEGEDRDTRREAFREKRADRSAPSPAKNRNR